MKRLVLIDGVNFFYKGCWANNPTLTIRGEDVTYIYAFVKNLISLIRKTENKEDEVKYVICWDGGYDERMKISSKAVEAGLIPKAYKQERRESTGEIMDPDEVKRREEFKRQLLFVEDLIKHTRVTSLFVKGEEADDLIGSLVYSNKDKYDETLLVTTDRDYYQLLWPNVKMFNSGKNEFKDEQFLKAEFNLDRAEQWVDVGALAGETGRTSDTIYGVPGISYITGSKLIAEYGSLDNLLKQSKIYLKSEINSFGNAMDLYKAVKAKEYKLKHHVKEMYVLAHEEIVILAKQLKQIRTWLNLEFPEQRPSLMELTNTFNNLNFMMSSKDVNLLTTNQ